jgi:hypothetical protein
LPGIFTGIIEAPEIFADSFLTFSVGLTALFSFEIASVLMLCAVDMPLIFMTLTPFALP